MKPLDLETFQELLDRLGARLEHWPARDAQRAQSLLETSAEARRALQEAERLRAALSSLPGAEPTAALAARILALPRFHPRRQRSGWWPFGRLWVPVSAWSVALALGLWVGTAIDLELGSTEPSEQALGGDEWAELVDLGFARELSGEEAP